MHLSFDEEALETIAQAAYNANIEGDDIGARRLHAVFEELLEDVSFNAGGDNMPEVEFNISKSYVESHVKQAKQTDIKRYIL